MTSLRAGGAEEAEGEPAVGVDVERLRAELQTVERERIELRAQLDATAERLEAVEQQARRPATRQAAAAAASTSERTRPMPGPRTAAGGAREAGSDERPRTRFDRPAAGDTDAEPPRRAARRPAERTARRPDDTAESSAAQPSGPPLGARITDWLASLTGSRTEPQNGHTEGAWRPHRRRRRRAQSPPMCRERGEHVPRVRASPGRLRAPATPPAGAGAATGGPAPGRRGRFGSRRSGCWHC